MTVGEQPYQGDEALTGLLKKSGLTADLRQIRGLLAGVIAAPEGEHPDDWIGLVAPSADEPVRAQLRALKREVSASAKPPALAAGAPRLAALRKELAKRGLDGFLVPRADEHQGEYVPPRAERLRWLTGFTGSAGLAIVLTDKAAVFVDGRYTLQVRSQTDTSLFEPRHSTERAAGGLDQGQSAQGRQDRLRPVAAYADRPEAPAQGGECRRWRTGGAREQPARCGVERSAPGADRAGHRAGHPLRRPQFPGQAREHRPVARRSRYRGDDPRWPRFHRLAVEHPRRRCAAHAVRARLCRFAQGWRRRAVHGPAQIHPRPGGPSRQSRGGRAA